MSTPSKIVEALLEDEVDPKEYVDDMEQERKGNILSRVVINQHPKYADHWNVFNRIVPKARPNHSRKGTFLGVVSWQKPAVRGQSDDYNWHSQPADTLREGLYSRSMEDAIEFLLK